MTTVLEPPAATSTTTSSASTETSAPPLGPVIGLSTVLGPVVAGLLMKADLFGSDWRALFLINLPVGVFAIVFGSRVLPNNPPARAGQRLDGVGTALLATLSFLLVFPLVDGRTQGWPVWMFALLVAAV